MRKRDEMQNFIDNINWYQKTQSKSGWKKSRKAFIEYKMAEDDDDETFMVWEINITLSYHCKKLEMVLAEV